jgi:hypothetical protein
MPYATKERPKCRKVLAKLCQERGQSIVELWERIRNHRHRFSDSVRSQCRLMVYQYWREREQCRRE